MVTKRTSRTHRTRASCQAQKWHPDPWVTADCRAEPALQRTRSPGQNASGDEMHTRWEIASRAWEVVSPANKIDSFWLTCARSHPESRARDGGAAAQCALRPSAGCPAGWGCVLLGCRSAQGQAEAPHSGFARSPAPAAEPGREEATGGWPGPEQASAELACQSAGLSSGGEGGSEHRSGPPHAPLQREPSLASCSGSLPWPAQEAPSARRLGSTRWSERWCRARRDGLNPAGS